MPSNVSDCTICVGEACPKKSETADRKKYFSRQNLCCVEVAQEKDNENIAVIG